MLTRLFHTHTHTHTHTHFCSTCGLSSLALASESPLRRGIISRGVSALSIWKIGSLSQQILVAIT